MFKRSCGINMFACSQALQPCPACRTGAEMSSTLCSQQEHQQALAPPEWSVNDKLAKQRARFDLAYSSSGATKTGLRKHMGWYGSTSICASATGDSERAVPARCCQVCRCSCLEKSPRFCMLDNMREPCMPRSCMFHVCEVYAGPTL